MKKLFIYASVILSGSLIGINAQQQTYSMSGYPTTISSYGPDAHGDIVKVTTIQCDGPTNVNCMELVSSTDLSDTSYTRPFDILTQFQGTLKYYNNGTPVIESGIFNRFSGSFSGSKSTFILEMQ